MHQLVQEFGIRQFAMRETVILAVAFLIAEVFHKCDSFALVTAIFLATG